MRTIKRITLFAALFSVVLLTGCIGFTTHKQVLVKSTVFGLQFSQSPTGGLIPSVQFGLCRQEYFSNPTSTNAISAAPFTSHVTAHIGLTQDADELISTK